ncbi:hypothetical protein [Loktanella sp. S4079]|uniref:hypothetical protein n=1 Tax=Loktanella sp. S4079 TaxID=579483 RepID=UPI0012EE336C|nr:hypothetical protein [Loktanella sp. S4079]
MTCVMIGVAWFLALAPGTNGIDDAAITRSYSQNIANGHGFVYNIGGERVEGATSMLWTLILVLPYLFNDNPEITILTITAIFTTVAVYFGFQIASRATANAQPRLTLGLMALALAGMPAFFLWSTWSMMEVAIWSASCMILLDRLSYLTDEATEPPRVDIGFWVVALALPAIRPEGIAVTFGLVALAVILRPAIWRVAGIGMITALISFGAVIAGRIAYFGYPFPNTYYAKVSADRLQNIIDGAKYLISFVSGQPFAELIIVAWVVLGGTSLFALFTRPAAGHRTQILATATVLGMLSVYVMLGGDHFVQWRFYQPIMPIFALPVVICAVWLRDLALAPRFDRNFAVILVLAGSAWIVINAFSYYQSRVRIGWEFELSHRGEVFGDYMNQFDPQPTMGVTAAGGIALTYDGELRDLMGLNWVEMAHANPIKEGFRNHASFDVDTFWKHQPELVAQFHRPNCQRQNWTEAASQHDTGVKQLFFQPQFQEQYTPIILDMADGTCTNAFAANTWLDQIESDLITPVPWQDISLISNAAH